MTQLKRNLKQYRVFLIKRLTRIHFLVTCVSLTVKMKTLLRSMKKVVTMNGMRNKNKVKKQDLDVIIVTMKPRLKKV